MKFTYKNKKETDKERKHIDIFIDDKYVGYIINEIENKFAVDNWYFVYSYNFTIFKNVPENFKIKGSISAKTKKELIDIIENL